MIKVRITGPSASGKSLLTCILRWQLRLMGLNVVVQHNTQGTSIVGCADVLRTLNTQIVILDSEGREPDDS